MYQLASSVVCLCQMFPVLMLTSFSQMINWMYVGIGFLILTVGKKANSPTSWNASVSLGLRWICPLYKVISVTTGSRFPLEINSVVVVQIAWSSVNVHTSDYFYIECQYSEYLQCCIYLAFCAAAQCKKTNRSDLMHMKPCVHQKTRQKQSL